MKHGESFVETLSQKCRYLPSKVHGEAFESLFILKLVGDMGVGSEK